MKKRAKIITTIASLCLAVALMAFGVFAATSATLGVTSKVKFTVVDVLIEYNVKVVGGKTYASGDPAGNARTAAANLYGGLGYGKTYDWRTNEDYGIAKSADLVLGETDGEIEFDSTTAAGRTITYLITVYNAGSNTAYLHVTATNLFAESVSSADTNMTVVYKKAVNTASYAANEAALSDEVGAWAGDYTLETHKYATFFVSITVEDVTKAVSTGNVLDVDFVANLVAPVGD